MKRILRNLVLVLMVISATATVSGQYKRATAQFTATPVKGCVPLSVQFTDISIKGTANIVAWEWNFGDNTAPSTLKNPLHTFTLVGNFSVRLRVKDQNGYWSYWSQPTVINVSDTFDVTINVNPTLLCQLPAIVAYSVISPSSTPKMKYQWNWGNTTRIVNRNITTPGNYCVTVTVTDSNNCAATYKGCNAPIAEHVVARITGPDTVCQDIPTNFTGNTSSGASIYSWVVTNPTMFYTTPNITHTFADCFLGTACKPEQVQLTVFSASGLCSSTANKDAIIDCPQAVFLADTDWVCGYPQDTPPMNDPVCFTDISSACGKVTGWDWTFSGSSTATQQNPCHVFQRDQPRTACLLVTSNHGCKSDVEYCQDIIERHTEFTIEADTNKGCIPLIDSFFIKISNMIFGITEIEWHIDKDNRTGTFVPYDIEITFDTLLVYTFTEFGRYRITAIVKDRVCGPDTVELSEYITPGDTTRPDFYIDNIISKDSVAYIIDDIVRFIDNTKGGSRKDSFPDEWNFWWDFDSRDFRTSFKESTGQDTVDENSYYTDSHQNITNLSPDFYRPGWVSVAHWAEHSGCRSDTVNKPLLLIGPQLVDSFFVVPKELNDTAYPLKVCFKAKAWQSDSMVWNWGDGTKDTVWFDAGGNVHSSVKIYPGPKYYTTINDPILASPMIFDATPNPCTLKFVYPPDLSFPHNKDSVTYTFDNCSHCPDSVQYTICHWYKPSVCDESYYSKWPVSKRYRRCDSTYHNPDYIVAVTAFGCKIDSFQTVLSNPFPVHDTVKASFSLSDNQDSIGRDFCWNEVIRFNSDSSHYQQTATWRLHQTKEFPNQNVTIATTNHDSIEFILNEYFFLDTANYPDSVYYLRGYFDVDLLIQGFNGELDSIRINRYMRIHRPYAEFFIADTRDSLLYDTVICKGQSLKLKPYNNPLAKPDTTHYSYFWDFGTDTVTSPFSLAETYSYDTAGFFFPKLVITDILGCKDTTVLRNRTKYLADAHIRVNSIDFQDTVFFSNGKYQFWFTNYNNHWIYHDTIVYRDSILIEEVIADFILDTSFNKPCQLQNTHPLNIRDMTTAWVNRINYEWKYYPDGNADYLYDATTYVPDTNTPYDRYGKYPYETTPPYYWKTQKSPLLHYSNWNIDTIRLIAIDYLGCRDTAYQIAYIHPKPLGGFYTNDTLLACYPTSQILFNDTSHVLAGESIVSWEWDFGDGTPRSPLKGPYHQYWNADFYDILFRVTSVTRCIDTVFKPNYIHVIGPRATITPVSTDLCLEEGPQFTVTDPRGVVKFIWHLSADEATFFDYEAPYKFPHDSLDNTTFTQSFPSFKYDSANTYQWYVEFSDIDTGGCVVYYPNRDANNNLQPSSLFPPDLTAENITVNPLDAYFYAADTACGVGAPVRFINKVIDSSSVSSWQWIFGGPATSATSSDPNPTNSYTALGGPYTVQLLVEAWYAGGLKRCADTVIHSLNVYPPPQIDTVYANRYLICPGDTTMLHTPVIDSISYNWQPASAFSGSNTIREPHAKPTYPTQYQLIITKDVSFCSDTTTLFVNTQTPIDFTFGVLEGGKQIITEEIFLPLGDTVRPFVITTQKTDTIIWVDATFDKSGKVVLFPQTSTDYKVRVYDTLGCPYVEKILKVTVSDGSVDMPTAFSPNGDGINDIIKFDGRGIKRLVDLKIYNRWGQVVFETQDINQGWDGKFNGKIQNVDTYVYTLVIETLKGTQMTKTGTFVLLK